MVCWYLEHWLGVFWTVWECVIVFFMSGNGTYACGV